MTKQMQRLTARVDGLPATEPPTSIPTPFLLDGGQTQSITRQPSAIAIDDYDGPALGGAGVRRGCVPRAIEALALIEPGEMNGYLSAAGLM